MEKLTIITGASSGMGKEFALQLSSILASGFNRTMLLISRNENALLEAKNEIEENLRKSASGTSGNSNLLKIKTCPMDAAGKKGIEEFEKILESERNACGEIEIEYLVNNAGFGVYGPFEDAPLDRQIEMVDLNCTTLMGFCYKALPYMKKGSTIINVASLAAFLPLGNFAVYGATKSFALSFSDALAAEVYDKGIKVCALCPGPVSTNFANVASNGAREKVRHGVDAKKVVAHCIKKALKGHHEAIYCFKWKFKAFVSRFVNRFAGARFTFLYCKRPYRH